MAIQFTKMSGSGNDFVIIDNRKSIINDSKKVDFVKRVCDRKMSVGADGVIFLEESDKFEGPKKAAQAHPIAGQKL